MLRKSADTVVIDVQAGVTRRLLIHAGRLMAVEFAFRRGTVLPRHSHPHEQVGHFLSGRFELTIEGEGVFEATAGDSYYIPPGVSHGARCLESGRVLDVFTPIREDFLP